MTANARPVTKSNQTMARIALGAVFALILAIVGLPAIALLKGSSDTAFDGYALTAQEVQKDHCPACRLNQINFDTKQKSHTAIIRPDYGQCLLVNVTSEFELRTSDRTEPYPANTGNVKVCGPQFAGLYRVVARKR